MKIILTGATGFIGGETLNQCLKNPAITSIIVLSRRALPESTNNQKLKVFIMEDFTSYPDSVIKELAGAEACIWSLSGKLSNANPVVEVEYPLAFANAIAKSLPSEGKRFRFVFLSGVIVTQDQDARLLYKQEIRKLKGVAETRSIEFAQSPEAKGLWETYVVRPAFVLPASGVMSFAKFLGGSSFAILVNELAAGLIEVASNGSKEQIISNANILAIGQKSLTRSN